MTTKSSMRRSRASIIERANRSTARSFKLSHLPARIRPSRSPMTIGTAMKMLKSTCQQSKPSPFDRLDYHSKALFFAHGRHRHRVTEDHIRAARRAYYGMISYIDDKIGRILDTLDKTRLADNTAIFFVSDHGEMLGERGMWSSRHFGNGPPMFLSLPRFQAIPRASAATASFHWWICCQHF